MCDCGMGIDPGLSGAISIIKNNEIVYIQDIPTKKIIKNKKNKKIIDEKMLKHIVQQIQEQYFLNIGKHVVLEKSQPMAKQGIVSTFTNGVVFGQIYQCLIDHQFYPTVITSNCWKREFNLLCNAECSKYEKKEKTYQFAKGFFVNHNLLLSKNGKLIDGRSDATVMALYAVLHAGENHD